LNLSNYVSSLEGVDTLGTIWLVIGVVGFVAVVLWVLKLKKSYLDKMETLPLDADDGLSDNLKKVQQ
jgi:hypothetical protein